MIGYRICQAVYAATAAEMIAGGGGLYSSGRWHTAGRPIVYMSQSLSLAAHEIAVHYPRGKHALTFVMSRIIVPDALATTLAVVDVTALPAGWDAQPPRWVTQAIGDSWLLSESSAVLQVPSVIIPGEFNYLINPVHPRFEAIKASHPEPFSFDPRL